MKKATAFKKAIICHTNDFSPAVNDRIQAWVESKGATFQQEFTPAVTHFVVSRKAWKRLHPLVREARRARTAWIVRYDWLEDSLLSKPVKALPVDNYLYEKMSLRIPKKAKKSTTAKIDDGDPATIKIPRDKKIDAAGIEFDKAKQEFENDMLSAGFHPYYDKTGFIYIVTLLRYDILYARFEKYRLKLFESDEEPYTYACYTQFSRPGISKQLLTLAPVGSTWEFAWTMFQKYFKQKVGTTWDTRSENGTEIKLDRSSEDLRFQYQAPRLNEPEGLRKVTLATTRNTSEIVKHQVEKDLYQEHQHAGVVQGDTDVGQYSDKADPDDSHLP